jgi:hypothetical protein
MYQLSYNYFVTEVNIELFKRVEIQPRSTCLVVFDSFDGISNYNFLVAAKTLLDED